MIETLNIVMEGYYFHIAFLCWVVAFIFTYVVSEGKDNYSEDQATVFLMAAIWPIGLCVLAVILFGLALMYLGNLILVPLTRGMDKIFKRGE